MSKISNKLAIQAEEIDSRYSIAAGLRRQINKVFPSHWSFLLGEIALYSFIILLLTGVYLTLFFDPSMTEVIYKGTYQPLKGIVMSKAYASALDISFEVRGGLFIRQLHHWAALLFAASIMIHLARIFFTGAFRRPREANWVIGCVLLLLAFFEGFFGYSLPDDLLSGTGVRAAMSGIVLGIPLIGTWLQWLLFNGDFPGNVIIPRMFTLHILILPGIILALIGIHLALVWYQKHTQFPGPGRTENNVVGVRILPIFAIKSGAFFAIIIGVLAIMSGLFQINPIWDLGPYNPAHVSAGSQPDIYMMFTDGLARLWPAWEIYIFGHTIPAIFGVVVVLLIIFVLLFAYPFIEKKITKDDAHHNILQRPRDVPVRTSIGVAAITFYWVLTLSCMNDIIAYELHISLNAMTWVGRIGLIILPQLAYIITYRICISLQRSDREVLAHGIESGIIKMQPNGAFIEIHQPIGPVDEHGHQKSLSYEGTAVPKKANQLGFAGKIGSGSIITADSTDDQLAFATAKHDTEKAVKIALEKLQSETES